MSTFVLVHGAFRGGWSWSRVRPLLVDRGHDVHAPSLTGAGERANLPVTTLDTWVDEIAGLLFFEDLTDVVLVGHSQGGVVVTAVADRVPDRIARLAYLDAAVPLDGERAVDIGPGAPPDLPPREMLIPSRPLVAGGDLDAETAQWTNRRLTPTPFGPSLDPVSTKAAATVPRTYAFCSGTPESYPSQATRGRLDAEGVTYDVLEAGHDAPLTAPAAVVDFLLREVPRS